MISKELLSEVEGSDIYFKKDAYDGYMERANIHELAHKCKEWARTNYGAEIWSNSVGTLNLYYTINSIRGEKSGNEVAKFVFDAVNELYGIEEEKKISVLERIQIMKESA